MAIRKRTSKSVAKRHDLNYFKKGSPIRLWQWKLALAAVIAAVVWVGVSSARSAEAFSSGPLSHSHAVFGQKCEACHIPVIAGAGWMPVVGNRHKVPDTACLSCHTTVGPHHAGLASKPASCSSCHVEHTGSMHLAATPNQGCTQCHGNLSLSHGSPTVATNIESFTKGHPEFRPLRLSSEDVRSAAFGLKFNHAEHLKPNLTGPIGQGPQTLACQSCHQVEERNGRDQAHSGRMLAVSFDKSCRACHTLEFDKAVKEQAPHGTSAEALAFLTQKMAATHPGDASALGKAETILFRDKCALCHTVEGVARLPLAQPVSLEAPPIQPSKQPERFFSAAVFSHASHSVVQCAECHTAALTSESGKDLLLPSIKTCQRCHDGESRPQGPALANGHAESGCFLCHVYHEGKPQLATGTQTFRIDELRARQ
jgi:hypothetical protein